MTSTETEYGELTLTLADRVDGSPGRIVIDSAPERIRISDVLIRQLRAGDVHPDARLDDAVLTITGLNRTVAYRIEGYDPERRCYEAGLLS